jgi:hypothetical protein
MEFAIVFGPRLEDVEITTSGAASVDGFREMNDALVANERFEAPMRILLDHTALQACGGRAGEDLGAVAWHVSLLRRALAHSRVAIVAPGAVKFGLAQMSGSHREDTALDLAVFESRRDAVFWLRGAP